MAAVERHSRRAGVWGLLAKRDNLYAGADLDNAQRILGMLWLLSTLLIIAYIPFDPPVEAVGLAGWGVAAIVAVAGIAIPRAMLKRTYRPSFDAMLAYGYLGLAQVALFVWLAGGGGTSYSELFLFWAVASAGIHPPRRGVPFLIATSLVAALPLVYGGWSTEVASDIITTAMMWTALGAVVMALMTYVRHQRVKLTEGEQQAQGLARADELTGLPNRRAFQEELEAEIARTRRAESPLSVAVLDIDQFKQVNDEHGHLQGDKCLQQLASVLKQSMRAGDRCFRWGGDEFAVLLPDTSYEHAQRVLERLIEAAKVECLRPDGEGLAISFGVAELDDTHSAEDLVGYADLELLGRKGAQNGASSGSSSSEPARGKSSRR
jgi:diguanylate cyclase (GGDEF)-like protein